MSLRHQGFSGFLPINELRRQLHSVPGEAGHIGIYVVLRPHKAPPKFLVRGSGGYFKGRNPNVDINLLESRWIEKSEILYIGKAGALNGEATLRSRLQAYLSFGKENRTGHWGGRFIWQMEDHEDLLVCWKLTRDSSPREQEKLMIQDFKRKFGGNRPFANLRD